MLHLKLSIVRDDDTEVASVQVAQDETEKLPPGRREALLAAMSMKLAEIVEGGEAVDGTSSVLV